jgi:hypothetical protein
MSAVVLIDAAGRRRSPATVPGYQRGRPPRNKGRRYPADPPRVEEIIAVMRAAGAGVHGARMRALVVVLWRAGLRINEALSLAETDLEPRRGAILWFGMARGISAGRWGWTSGLGSSWSRGRGNGSSCRWVRSFAYWRVRLKGARGRPAARGLSCGGWRLWLASVDGSLPTNMPTWLLCRCWLKGARRSAGSRHVGGITGAARRLWIEPLH